MLGNNLAESYRIAFEKAQCRLQESDPAKLASMSNSIYDSSSRIMRIKFFNEEYLLNLENNDISKEKSDEEAGIIEKTLMLHYLLGAKATHLSGRLISFREVPDSGLIYDQTFVKRAVAPMVRSFRSDIGAFQSAAASLGGVKETYGSASATIKLFPLVPVTYVLWLGDEEFDASGTILFDSSVSDFLPGEDIVVAASMGVYKMIGMAKKR